MPDSSVRGFAWLVKPGVGFSADPNLVPWGGTPVPLHSWPIGPNETGIRNRYGNLAYVALTGTPIPPEVRAGWEVEPAQLDTDFDTTGARMIRETGFRETPHGHISECLFEVAGP